MKKFFLIVLLASLPVLGVAAGHSTTSQLQVSFTVNDSCNIAAHGQQATVSCDLHSPYLVLPPERAPSLRATVAAGADDAAHGRLVVVYF